MHLQKHSLDGGDHYSPEPISGTNQELLARAVEVSSEGYLVTLAVFTNNSVSPDSIHAVAISGMLVTSSLPQS